MMEYTREAPKTEYLGWGRRAIRKVTTRATSPRLLKYRECIARHLSGKTFANLKAIQEEFRRVAETCAREAACEETTGKLPKGFTHKYACGARPKA